MEEGAHGHMVSLQVKGLGSRTEKGSNRTRGEWQPPAAIPSSSHTAQAEQHVPATRGVTHGKGDSKQDNFTSATTQETATLFAFAKAECCGVDRAVQVLPGHDP